MKEIFPGVTVDPNVQFGKPLIAGTRIPVEIIVGHIAAGETIDQLIAQYQLTREDILAALKYASKIVGEETVMMQ